MAGRERLEPLQQTSSHPGVSPLEQAKAAFKEFKSQPNFQSLPVDKAYNWEEVWPNTGLKKAVLFVFDSKLKQNADVDKLEELDLAAWAEAGNELIHYNRGVVEDPTEGNRSLCVWPSFEAALRVSEGPLHEVAKAYAYEAYDVFTLTPYTIDYNSRKDTLAIAHFRKPSTEAA